jgi:hypothetical protein
MERNYYKTGGVLKRFFDVDDIKILFKKWKLIVCKEYEKDRYSIPKVLWEIAAKKL